MTFFLLLLPPLLAALLAAVVRPYRSWVGWVNACLSLLPLAAALIFASQAIAGHEAPVWGIALGPLALAEVLRADSLAALIMVCVAAVAALTLWLSPGVGKASVKASWKYILLSSVGIALAFAGTVLAYFDFVALSGRIENALNWDVLLTMAPVLHREVMQIAFVFLLVGYGAKAGIAPMHTWKPDAYGEAPPPLTALMSSALFAVAMLAIVRWKAVADITLGSGFTDNLLIALGVLSLLIAAFSVVLTTNYKRMLAYSSIEHTGLICLGLGLGPLGAWAALLHLVNHTAAKSLMFLLVDTIEQRFVSPLIANTHGLLKALPWTGALFAAGLLILIGLPPGGILALLAIIFASFISHLNHMLYGAPPAAVSLGERASWRTALLVLSVIFLVTLGLTMPAPLATLLKQSVQIIAP